MNRSMVAKHAKAKKCAMQEVMDNAKAEMCCKTIPNNVHKYPNFYANYSSIFYSKSALQKRINIIAGRYYPAEEFRKEYGTIYEYLLTHTVPETMKHFGKELEQNI